MFYALSITTVISERVLRGDLGDRKMKVNGPGRSKSNFGDFSNGACHVMKTTIAESSPDMEPFTQQTFRFVPDIRCQ